MLTKAFTRLPTELRILLLCETRIGASPARPKIPIPWSSPLCPHNPRPHLQTRSASSASSSRWKTRQSNDSYAREAKVAGLKSRAAFKLLEINDKYRLFRPGDTVVDLGYAPGSWSQVALNRTQPGGRVVGIDIIPAQPPRGVSTLQGDFLSGEIREELRRFVVEGQGRPRRMEEMVRREGEDLCHAALTFAFDTLGTGGNFLCKFYQGEEDKALELWLKKLFEKTYRIKPDSSRKESKEAYFVGLRRKAGAVRNEVLGGG
ncbi:hypothetical protein KC343_g2581 [Hortaea werneckii]|nr:hypothetical protein KC323_g3435 [Hortaea werneckii]KAI7254813.1 hypothetical protein KC352_g11715 [Hortaea werneckii]KAI7346918.1 hypothetical protein KC320_g7560 [Hortaea werneckii]KAI7570139.1 hypothetical protein KC317_g2728 [Hortaea werneckii]KAI7624201.1 hypothetical protein KC346_g2322 [Hortaea werneckii]